MFPWELFFFRQRERERERERERVRGLRVGNGSEGGTTGEKSERKGEERRKEVGRREVIR